jgi:hypothetical protein
VRQEQHTGRRAARLHERLNKRFLRRLHIVTQFVREEEGAFELQQETE